MSSKWDKFWHSQSDVKYSWSKKRIVRILDKYSQSGMKVLDAGCGSGFFSSYFIHKGCDTYSLDLSEQALALTKKLTSNGSKKYLCENLLDGRFAAKYSKNFDVIFSDGLFEHFNKTDQNRVFNNFVTMSKGYIITFVPNKYTLWRILQPFYMRGIKEKPFSMAELLMLYRGNGYNVLSCGGINVLPVKVSPEKLFGKSFGMLLYCVGAYTDNNKR
jgi:SAM-dependent methyltransferase